MKIDSAEGFVNLSRLETISAVVGNVAPEVMCSDPLGRTIAFVC